MKIGILTYHRAENYGALLQAYGLKTYLETLGHDVSFVDYWPDYHKEYFDLFPIAKYKSADYKTRLKIIINYCLFYPVRKTRKTHLQEFMFKHLGLPKNIKYSNDSATCNDYDVVFYGSDQIWRKQGMPSHPGFDLWYLGSDNIITHKKIAYAASMGHANLQTEDYAVLKKEFQNFSSISVREKSLELLVADLGFPCKQVIDPVFLLSKAQWQELSHSARKMSECKYILIYNLLSSQETVRFAEKLSREKKLPIIEINKRYVLSQFGNRYNHTARVEEFLWLIENAEYVVSNSFHGVALSIIFQKQFFAVGMGEKADRVVSLLDILGIKDQYILADTIDNGINYGLVLQNMNKEIERSTKYIIDSIDYAD